MLVKFASGKVNWLNKPILPGQLKPWLIDHGSLTSSLRRRYPDFKVRPVALKFAKAIVDETNLLHIPAHNTALIREVLLLGGGHPLYLRIAYYQDQVCAAHGMGLVSWVISL